MNSLELANKICLYLDEKKGVDIVKIDVRGKSDLTDYFVVCSGKSPLQVKALVENLDEKMSKDGIEPKRCDGLRDGRWAVLDYGDVIVHIFNDEMRLFYHIEKLWGDEKSIEKYEG